MEIFPRFGLSPQFSVSGADCSESPKTRIGATCAGRDRSEGRPRVACLPLTGRGAAGSAPGARGCRRGCPGRSCIPAGPSCRQRPSGRMNPGRRTGLCHPRHRQLSTPACGFTASWPRAWPLSIPVLNSALVTNVRAASLRGRRREAVEPVEHRPGIDASGKEGRFCAFVVRLGLGTSTLLRITAGLGETTGRRIAIRARATSPARIRRRRAWRCYSRPLRSRRT